MCRVLIPFLWRSPGSVVYIIIILSGARFVSCTAAHLYRFGMVLARTTVPFKPLGCIAIDTRRDDDTGSYTHSKFSGQRA